MHKKSIFAILFIGRRYHIPINLDICQRSNEYYNVSCVALTPSLRELINDKPFDAYRNLITVSY